jgi:hypothetical protein
LLRFLSLWLLVFSLGVFAAKGALQFDVFLGYDGIISEASWFPVVCEIKNDGPTFTGTVEIQGADYNQGATLRTVTELPTGTLKRLVLPVFCSARGYVSWNVRLLDERGKVRSEQLGLRARKQLAHSTPLLGAIPRTSGGTPMIKPILANASELQPVAARLQPSIFPDNPLVLEGMSCVYLNSERAADLSVTQVNALLAWLNAGGHLIVAVEQPSDITASPWLKSLFPCEVKDLQSVAHHPELQDWLHRKTWANAPVAAARTQNQYAGSRPVTVEDYPNPFANLPNDFDFEGKEMQVAVGRVREGNVEVSMGDLPVIVTASHGRGRLTALLFSPEREPMRSWKNLETFWAKVVEVPGALYAAKDLYTQGGWSSDGIFGAMIDTRQVHKLPVGWLLLLMLVYLVVIGPLDQFWLKRIGKPMLTWITFPCYVVLFSLVIYFIGYKLRAGESEWNELNIVDVLQNGPRAELRGRTYASVYSPSNQRYNLEGQQKNATLRGEFALWGGSQSSERTTVLQSADTFKAEIFVPVWTSELFVSDWWQPSSVPVNLSLRRKDNSWELRMENRTDQSLTNLLLAIDNRIIGVGGLAARESKTLAVTREQGTLLRNFVSTYGSDFQGRVGSRQRALGATESGQILDKPNASVAACFLSQLSHQQNWENNFVSPPGLDLTSVVQRGGAVLLAWAPDYSPVPSMRQFTPRRLQRDTLWRFSVPIE